MTRDEEIMAAIFAERGYMVIQLPHGQALRVGQSLAPGCFQDMQGHPVECEQRFYVLAETDYADYAEQDPIVVRYRGPRPAHIPVPKDGPFYRVGTD